MRDFKWTDRLWAVVKNDGTFAGVPCTSREEADELSNQHEGSYVFELHFPEISEWERNARQLEQSEDAYVNWKERYYSCPYCGELVYECDWTDRDFGLFFCPICEDYEEEEKD